MGSSASLPITEFPAKFGAYIEKVYGIPAKEFNRALLRDNAVVTGGFVVGLLTNETEKYSDIDVFAHLGHESLSSLLIKNGFTSSVCTSPETWLSCPLTVYTKTVNGAQVGPSIHLIISGIAKGIVDQPFGDVVVALFDISLVQNYYDGYDLVCKSPQDILNREFSITRPVQAWEDREKRIVKYTSRGYKLVVGTISKVTEPCGIWVPLGPDLSSIVPGSAEDLAIRAQQEIDSKQVITTTVSVPCPCIVTPGLHTPDATVVTFVPSDSLSTREKILPSLPKIEIPPPDGPDDVLRRETYAPRVQLEKL